MRRKWIFFVAPPAALLVIALCGEVVMHLWNWLIPAIVGWSQITLWQALGLLVLSRILFGSWGGGGGDRSRSCQPSAKRWAKMTPEEREKFRQEMRSRCGGFGTPSGEFNEPAP